MPGSFLFTLSENVNIALRSVSWSFGLQNQSLSMKTEALEGGGGSQYPIKLYWKISHIPKINMANIPKIQKALYPHIPEIDRSIPYPFKYLQKFHVSL